MKTRPPTAEEIAEARRAVGARRKPGPKARARAGKSASEVVEEPETTLDRVEDTRFAEGVLAELDAGDLRPLAEAVAKRHHVPVLGMLGRSRLRRFAKARHAFWYALRYLGDRDYSWSDIGDLVGCDATAILRGARAHGRCLAAGPGVVRAEVAAGETRVA